MTDISFFVPVHATQFRVDEELPFNLYVKVGELYVLKVSGGTLLDDEVTQSLKKYAGTQFYILDTDESAYLKYVGDKSP